MIVSVAFAFLKTAVSGLIKRVVSGISALVNFAKEHPKLTALLVGALILTFVSFRYGETRGIKKSLDKIEILESKIKGYEAANSIQKKTIEDVERVSKKLSTELIDSIKRNEETVAKIVGDYDKKLVIEKSKSKVIEVPYAIEITKEGKTQIKDSTYKVFVGTDGKPYCDRFSNTFLETVNNLLGVQK
jgi:hypothetical protein